MLSTVVLAAALTLPAAFQYDATAPLNVRQNEHAVTFAGADGRDVTGVYYAAATPGQHAAILFVHWLGDEATTNHTEFEEDAQWAAAHGADALCIDAMWSKKDWFEKGRSPKTDARDSVAQVIDLRRSLDFLLAHDDVDRARVAVVAHDFGAMYAAVVSGIDTRPRYYVFMAGTSSFSQWYLLGAKPADVAAYKKEMAPFDPPKWLAHATATELFFQFALDDQYVSPLQAFEFQNASRIPRAAFYYATGHALHTTAVRDDRRRWLTQTLQLAAG